MQTATVKEKYLKAQVETASPGELTVLLYQELVRTLLKAKKLIVEGDTELGTEALYKARSIIFEFMSTLNMKYDLSKDLYALYEFYSKCIVDYILSRNMDLLDEIISFAKGMLETWKQALQIVKAEK